MFFTFLLKTKLISINVHSYQVSIWSRIELKLISCLPSWWGNVHS